MTPTSFVAGAPAGWRVRQARTHLSLAGGMNEFVPRLTRKFRRNFFYYRRRAVAAGCVFLPELTDEQSYAAVRAIQPHVRYPVSAAYADRLNVALRDTPGNFAMGMVDSAGEWIGYLAGWRRPDATYVEWQLNRLDHASDSLSTVMRSYFVEHEAERGVVSVVFVGGAAELWSRVCEPAWCADLALTRPGIVGRLARELTCRLRPNGRLAALFQQKHEAPDASKALGSRTRMADGAR